MRKLVHKDSDGKVNGYVLWLSARETNAGTFGQFGTSLVP